MTSVPGGDPLVGAHSSTTLPVLLGEAHYSLAFLTQDTPSVLSPARPELEPGTRLAGFTFFITGGNIGK